MGVGASGGCGAMELISMGCIFLPDVDALHRPRLQDSIGYGRERIRTVSFLQTDLGTPVTCGYVGAISRGYGDFILPELAVGAWSSKQEVVPPLARGTRAVRTPQKGRQVTSRPSSSWVLRDEPDDTEPGLRPPTEDAPEHRADPIDPKSPPRALGRKRSRRDRSQSSGEPLECFLQREYVDRAIDRALAGVSSRAQRSPTSDSWFDGLEDPSTELKDVHMSYFLSAIARRVRRDPGCPTAVANTGLYEALIGAWKILHPLDPDCRGAYVDNDYRRWIPAEGLIHRIQVSDGQYQVAWKGRDYAIVVCDIAGQHWVVVRIRFSDWVVELYDSLLFQMDDLSDREGRQMPPRCAFAMTLDKSIPNQYMQMDSTSCGVYACMYMEWLLGAGPASGIPEEAVHAYRKVIGARIYSLTYIKRPGV
ncbi:hypothetical protein C2S51_037785 [Perilla frutescens var. frutescens]|nr:hypothetical protein C2S51_037785 [Perilla frutescens var. frutescens]